MQTLIVTIFAVNIFQGYLNWRRHYRIISHWNHSSRQQSNALGIILSASLIPSGTSRHDGNFSMPYPSSISCHHNTGLCTWRCGNGHHNVFILRIVWLTLRNGHPIIICFLHSQLFTNRFARRDFVMTFSVLLYPKTTWTQCHQWIHLWASHIYHCPTMCLTVISSPHIWWPVCNHIMILSSYCPVTAFASSITTKFLGMTFDIHLSLYFTGLYSDIGALWSSWGPL